MKECNQVFNQAFNLPNAGLRTYFQSVESGDPDVITTPFYRGRDFDSVVADWSKVLQAKLKKWPSLVEYEIDQSKKVGPMSVRKPLKQRMSDIDSYYDSVLLESTEIPDSATAATIKEFRRVSGLRERSWRTTVDNMKKSTNSGSPFFTKRRRVVSDTIGLRGGTDGGRTVTTKYDFPNVAVLGWRGQEGGPKPSDTKQRVVWMFPFAVNIAELSVYQPLVEACQATKLVAPWVGNEEVDKRITQLFDTKPVDDVVVCTDFSKFDQHFNPSMQRAALRVLQGLFTRTEGFKSWCQVVFPIKYNIPLAYNYGKVRCGPHGMGSGSGGTNADETLTHRCLQHEAAFNDGTALNPNSMCLGDDGVLTYPGITVDSVVRTYTSHGQEMNPDKQYVSKHDCIFLRRWHHTAYRENGICVGVYPTMRALGRLRYQERYYDPEVWGPKMVALRQLSILENIKHHPLREEFVQFCMKGDKYRLGIDIPGFLDNIEGIAKDAIDYMPDFLGYTRTLAQDSEDGQQGGPAGISTWWIVNYLKSLK